MLHPLSTPGSDSHLSFPDHEQSLSTLLFSPHSHSFPNGSPTSIGATDNIWEFVPRPSPECDAGPYETGLLQLALSSNGTSNTLIPESPVYASSSVPVATHTRLSSESPIGRAQLNSKPGVVSPTHPYHPPLQLKFSEPNETGLTPVTVSEVNFPGLLVEPFFCDLHLCVSLGGITESFLDPSDG